MTRFDGPAGAILVALAACILSSGATAGPHALLWWWLAGCFGLGGACLLISAGISVWLGE